MFAFFGGVAVTKRDQLHQDSPRKTLEVLAFGSASLPAGAAGFPLEGGKSWKFDAVGGGWGFPFFLKWYLRKS